MTVLSRRGRNADARRATEARLVEATLALLAEGSSFADLGIEQIVTRAGVSRPTFYAYFADKRALVLHLGTSVELELNAVAEPWFDGGEASARDALAAVLRVFGTHREAVRAVTEAAAYDAEIAAFWRRFHDRFLPGARGRIVVACPDLSEDEVTARAYALVYMTERTILEQLSQRLTDDAALLSQLAWFWEAATTAPRPPG